MMIIRLNTKAKTGTTVDKVGTFLTLVSCSAGSIRLKAFDSNQSELFNSVVTAGASIDFDFVATKIELETELDAEVVIFWSKSKFQSPVVNVQGAGVARMKTVAVNGIAKLNTINGQNKAIKLKAREGDVTLTGQAGSQVGGWTLKQGDEVSLETSGDVFARGTPSTMALSVGAQVDMSNAGITYSNKQFDKNGNLYGQRNTDNAVVGIGHATHSSWPTNTGTLTKWREKLFIVTKVSGGVTISEIVDGKQIARFIVKTSLALGTPSPSPALFSNDGNFVYCVFSNATGGAEHVILDLAYGRVSANWKASTKGAPVTDTIAAYSDGWIMAYGNIIWFIDKDGNFSEVQKTGDNLQVGLSATLRVSGGTIAIQDTQSYTLSICYDNSFDFVTKSVVQTSKALFVVGDFVGTMSGTGFKAYPRFELESTTNLGAQNAQVKHDATVYVAPDGAVTVAWAANPFSGAAVLTKMPVGVLSGPILPELVDVVELF
jgi:hypothetical protein